MRRPRYMFVSFCATCGIPAGAEELRLLAEAWADDRRCDCKPRNVIVERYERAPKAKAPVARGLRAPSKKAMSATLVLTQVLRGGAPALCR